ncbi:MAG: hypothetical protein ACYC2O_04395 [Microthrixaceae bacterium]
MDDAPRTGTVDRSPPRLPWEVVETLPSSDAELLAYWEHAVARAEGPNAAADEAAAAARIPALVGRALANYWAVQEGLDERPLEDNLADRARDTQLAIDLARADGDPDLLATALLGRLAACWGPDHLHERPTLLAELVPLADRITDEELRLRAREWQVVERFDEGDLDGARVLVADFSERTRDTELQLFRRRTELWRANLAMLGGDLDLAVRINTDAVSSTAQLSGTPFSVQNVAITMAIERHLRRGLDDVIDVIRSVRASSPRVGANWTSGLAFALGETGRYDEARSLLTELARDRFAAVPRDLNWLVTMQLLGLVAARVEEVSAAEQLRVLLEPFGLLDGTHGSGYASYGPVGRVLGLLSRCCADDDAAIRWFEQVLATRPPGPWTALTRLHLAETLVDTDAPRAHQEAERAGGERAAAGMGPWVDDAVAVGRAAARVAGIGAAPSAVRTGGTWVLEHPAGNAELADGVGVRLLVQLLARPGQALGPPELEGLDPSLPTTSTHEPALDPVARAAYRRRLDQLEGRRRPLREAEQTEVEALRRELAAGRYAPATSAELERARVRVTKALRRAIDAVGDRSPRLAEHLRASVTTGRRCCYGPADGAAWRVDPGD